MDKQRDANNFGKLLQANLDGHAGEKVFLSDDAKRWWWNALQPYPIHLIEQAFVMHTRRSVHKPKPADIIGFINQQDGRPSSDEAWPIALQAADEGATAVWTAEIEQAWYHCFPIFDQGDEVGARMSFRQYYDRLVTDARDSGVPVKWNVSLGQDPNLRTIALVKAEKQGLLSHDRVAQMLPAPEISGDGQHIAGLVGYDGKADDEPSADFQANIAKVREVLTKPVPNVKAQRRAEQKAIEDKRRAVLAEQQRLMEEARGRYLKAGEQ